MEYRLFDNIYSSVIENAHTSVVNDEDGETYAVPAHLGPKGRTHDHEDFLENGGPNIFTIKAEELESMDPDELGKIFSVRNILVQGMPIHEPWKWDARSFRIFAPLFQEISIQGELLPVSPIALF